MTTVRAFQVDAFTAERFTGNPAAVVLDADTLSTGQMQTLARELGQGDTVFVLPADDADHDLVARFFNPRREAAFVGHATLAAHAVLAHLGLPPRRRQRQKSGSVDVDVLAGSAPVRIAIHQDAPPPARLPDAGALQQALAALALTSADLDPRCPPAIVGETSTRLLLLLRDGARLAQLRPDLARLADLSATLAAPGYFVSSLSPSVPDVLTESRMFCPALGIPEDPVSGNAHGLLAAQLWQRGLLGELADGTLEFTGAQGHHVGRPGRVGVVLDVIAGRIESISLIGEAVVVFGATIEL